LETQSSHQPNCRAAIFAAVLFIGGQNDRPAIFASARDQQFLSVGRRSSEPEGFFPLWIFTSFGVFSGEEISSAWVRFFVRELQLPLCRRKS
jgi:hypothetical protein